MLAIESYKEVLRIGGLGDLDSSWTANRERRNRFGNKCLDLSFVHTLLFSVYPWIVTSYRELKMFLD
jgi:hypothetical protein